MNIKCVLKMRWLVVVLISVWLLPACSPPGRNLFEGGKDRLEIELDPGRQYAGDLLSYLVRVVLGREGPAKGREEWATVGLDRPLDLAEVYEYLSDPERMIQEVLPLDANILDLSQVLYTYDNRLSYSKGSFGLINVYPAAEFLAIRLFLLQKLNRQEKIHLHALIKKRDLLFNEKRQVSPEDLTDTNLSGAEMRLIRDILGKEPGIYHYLQHPFLVKALYELGLITGDEWVRALMAEARYERFPCRRSKTSEPPEGEDAVKIAILPSMVGEFYFGGKEGCDPYGFRPTEFLEEMLMKLEAGIRSATEAVVKREAGKEGHTGWGHEPDRIAKLIGKKLFFCVQDRRPLLVYPQNARSVIGDVCPQVDYTVVLLGKNVYLALDIGGGDVYPASNVSYIDISDVKHSQFQDSCDQIAQAVYERLRENMPQPEGGRP